jgi:hypothetical protein
VANNDYGPGDATGGKLGRNYRIEPGQTPIRGNGKPMRLLHFRLRCDYLWDCDNRSRAGGGFSTGGEGEHQRDESQTGQKKQFWVIL